MEHPIQPKTFVRSRSAGLFPRRINRPKLFRLVTEAYSKVFQIAKSRAEASRLIKQGSVQLDGEKMTDPKATVAFRPGQVLRLDKTHAVRVQ